MSITELLRPPRGDGHLLLLHASEDERRLGISTWVREGLERDEKIIYTERPDEPERSTLAALLGEQDVDAETATRQGRLELLSPEDFYPPGGWVAVAERALAGAYRRVRVMGDARTALRLMSRRHHLDLERAATDLCRIAPISVLCSYDEESASPQHLEEIVSAHREGIHERQLRTENHPWGIAVSGEIDLQNENLFEHTLRAAVRNATRFVLLMDLREVSFMSVGGARALAHTTRDFRDGGGVVRLVSPPSTVEWLLRTLRIDRQPGMEVLDRADAHLTEALS